MLWFCSSLAKMVCVHYHPCASFTDSSLLKVRAKWFWGFNFLTTVEWYFILFWIVQARAGWAKKCTSADHVTGPSRHQSVPGPSRSFSWYWKFYSSMLFCTKIVESSTSASVCDLFLQNTLGKVQKSGTELKNRIGLCSLVFLLCSLVFLNEKKSSHQLWPQS